MKYIYYSVAFIVIGAIIAVSVWYAARPVPLTIQGEVHAKQVQVAAKVPGNILSLPIIEGQQVKKGEVLATIDSPTLKAKEAQAVAAVKAAEAQQKKIDDGARQEEITALYNVYQKAVAAEQYAFKTYSRVKSLHDDGVVTTQSLDEALTQWKVLQNDVRASKANYEMARIGARPEDKTAAEALKEQAQGVLQEVMVLLEDTILHSPIDGEVSTVVVEQGELVTPGFPVITLVDLEDTWVTFYIREDLLKDIRIGTVINVEIPALSDNQVYPVEVRYIAPAGSYAVWSATKTSADFDLKTFEVKAYPQHKIPDLRAGMTAVFYSNIKHK